MEALCQGTRDSESLRPDGLRRLIVMFALYLLVLAPTAARADYSFRAISLYGELIKINPQTRQVAMQRQDMPWWMNEATSSPPHTVYAGRAHEIYAIDPFTGNNHVAASLPVGADIFGMALSPGGLLYLTSKDAGGGGIQTLYTLNLTTGVRTTVNWLVGCSATTQGLAFSPSGALYGIKPSYEEGSWKTLLFTVNPSNGYTSRVGVTTAGVNQAIAFTPTGELYAIGQDVFGRLNPSTGALIGSLTYFSGDWRGLAYVPEPTTVSLLGFGGLALLRRRCRP